MASRGDRSGEFAVCIHDGEDEIDLVVGKIYRVVRPKRNDRLSDIRVLDESGEDYLYPESYFAAIELPKTLHNAVLAAA